MSPTNPSQTASFTSQAEGSRPAPAVLRNNPDVSGLAKHCRHAQGSQRPGNESIDNIQLNVAAQVKLFTGHIFSQFHLLHGNLDHGSEEVGIDEIVKDVVHQRTEQYGNYADIKTAHESVPKGNFSILLSATGLDSLVNHGYSYKNKQKRYVGMHFNVGGVQAEQVLNGYPEQGDSGKEGAVFDFNEGHGMRSWVCKVGHEGLG